MKCKKCGVELLPTQKFCYNCGTANGNRQCSICGNIMENGYCIHCGRKQKSNYNCPQRYCIKCSKPVSGEDFLCEQCKAKKKRTTSLWMRTVAAVLVVVLLSGIAAHFVGNKPVDLTDEQIKISYQNYVNISKEINDYEAEFTGTDGYVDVDKVDSILEEMAVFAKQMHKEGKITDYSYRDGDSCVYMEIDGWLGVLYEPKVEGYLSGGEDIEILTLEPYASEFGTYMNYVISGMEGPDEGAMLVDERLKNFFFSHDLDDEKVTVETIRNLPSHSLIVMIGHGSYGYGTPTICISQTPDESFLKKYRDEISNDAIFVSPSGTVHISPIFMKKYMPQGALDGSIVYFCTCYSFYEKDSQMADSIIDLGAIAYLGNSDQIIINYAFNMVYAFFEKLVDIDVNGDYGTILDALYYAREKHGERDFRGTYVNMYYEYDFTLPEMIALKAGTYDIRENGEIKVIDANGEPCENYTMHIAKASNLNEIYLERGAQVTAEEVIANADEYRVIQNKFPQKLNLEAGIYEIAFVDNNNSEDKIVHTFQIFEDKGNRSISVQIGFGEEAPVEAPMVIPTETPTKDNILSGKCGDNLTWTLENGVLTISGTGAMYDYDPFGLSANSSATPAPWYEYACNNEVTSIQIGNGVTYIGSYAFACCWNIDNIRIPGNVKQIGEYAFFECCSHYDKKLKVIIEDGVETIGNGAFFQCFTMMPIDLPDSITYIGDAAFFGCYLENITIPPNVTYIGDQLFVCDDEDNHMEEIHFTGDAPTFAENTFMSTDAIAYYPANNKTWTFDVLKDYGGNITWIAEGKTDANEKALAAYRPIAEKYNVNSQEQNFGWYSGILIDLDNDNVQELALRYLSAPFEDAWWSEHKLSVYDYENGKVVTTLDGVTFGEIGGAGEDAYATILYKSGTPYVMTYNDFGETSSGGSMKPNRVATMTIYDGKTCKEVGVYRIERWDNVLSYQIDQKTVSEKEFINEIEQYQGVDVTCDLYRLIEFPEAFVTVSKLLQQMK